MELIDIQENTVTIQLFGSECCKLANTLRTVSGYPEDEKHMTMYESDGSIAVLEAAAMAALNWKVGHDDIVTLQSVREEVQR